MRVGILLIVAYAIITSIQEVFLGNRLQIQDPFLVLTICFSITTLFFGILLLPTYKHVYAVALRNLRPLIALNVSTLMSWAGYFVSVKYLEPAISAVLGLALVPILTIIFSSIIGAKSELIRPEKFSAIGVLMASAYLIWATLKGQSAIGNQDTGHVLIGFVAAMTSAMGIVGNTHFSKALYKGSFNAKQVMALRFFLLIGVGSLLTKSYLPLQSVHLCAELLVFTLITIVVPLYLLQRGIEKSKPMTVALVLAGIPAFILFVQSFDKRLLFSPHSVIGIFLSVAFVFYGISARMKVTREAT